MDYNNAACTNCPNVNDIITPGQMDAGYWCKLANGIKTIKIQVSGINYTFSRLTKFNHISSLLQSNIF
jgi:hypothetical protein